MKNDICCILNYAPHYRKSIFQLMDKELGCDFYFGDKVDGALEQMDYESLKGYKETVQNKKAIIKGFKWQNNVWRLIFKPYKHYILTGSVYILSNWPILILAKILGKQTYVWTHGMRENTYPKKRFLEKLFFGLSYKILLYGEHSKITMVKEGIKEEKLIPIYNSLDHEKQLMIRNKLKPAKLYKNHFNNNLPVLIYIGRIQKSKKVDTLINVLEVFKTKGNPCNLVIVGTDIENNEIPNLVKKYNLEQNVWFYGACYNEEEIGPLLYNADVCISPGLIGLTAIHSLTYGTPVITSDDFSNHGPEFEAIEPGITGDFFEEGNLDDLCNKIEDWISLNNIAREKVRQNAFAVIDQKYNPHNQVRILKNIIRK